MRRLLRNWIARIFTRPNRRSSPDPDLSFRPWGELLAGTRRYASGAAVSAVAHVRPALESLECREVPATVVWTGAVSTAAGNVYNWDLDFAGSEEHQLPAAGDDVSFAPLGVYDPHTGHENLVAVDCDDFHGPSGGSFNSVYVDPDYTATVTLDGGLTTKALVVAGGTIDQPASGTDITVTGGASGNLPQSFSWTAGTLNSTSNVANLIVTGSTTTALIAPANGGTVYCGDNITFENGATGTMSAGTVANTSNIAFDLKSGSAFHMNPGSLASSVLGQTLWRLEITIWPGTSLTVDSGVAAYRATIANGGTYTLMPNTTADINGLVGDDYAYEQPAPGNTFLYGGSMIVTGEGKKMKFQGGILATVSDDTFGLGIGNCDATLATDNLEVSGGDIYINYGGATHASFGTLTVVGNVIWNGGTYHPFVQGNVDEGNADLWYASGTFSAGGELSPVALDAQGQPTSPTSTYTWLILRGDRGITNNLTGGYNSNIWAIDTDGLAPPKRLWLRAW